MPHEVAVLESEKAQVATCPNQTDSWLALGVEVVADVEFPIAVRNGVATLGTMGVGEQHLLMSKRKKRRWRSCVEH